MSDENSNKNKKTLKNKNYLLISNSKYFDANWYKSHYDIGDMDPVKHYMQKGFKKGYDPGPDFSTIEYYQCNSDVEHAGINPLFHYEKHGRAENRKISYTKEEKDDLISIISNSEYFDADWYKTEYDIGDIDPAYHYLFLGFKKDYNPGPNFNTIEYNECNRDVENAGMNPLFHYEKYGRAANRKITLTKDEKDKFIDIISNSKYFDGDWYKNKYNMGDVDPAYHYLFIGYKRGCNPGPNFINSEYYERNEDVKNANMNPLIHYELSCKNQVKNSTKFEDYGRKDISLNDEISKYYPIESDKKRILLIGHSGNNGGAEILLKNMIQEFRKQDIEVAVCVKKDGPILDEYRKMAPTFLITDEKKVKYHIKELTKFGFKSAILNTVICGDVIPILQKNNYYIINLIHELPGVITILNAKYSAITIAESSDRVIFPSSYVLNKFDRLFKIKGEKLIQPQGFYNTYNNFNWFKSREKLEKKHNIPENNNIILNVGLGEHRKGFDLFIETAKKLREKNYTFIWVGSVNDSMIERYETEIENNENIILTGFIDDKDELMTYFDASDIFLLTSREDPFPSVVLEAFNAETPVIGFEDAGGFRDIVINGESGYLVEFESTDQLADKIQAVCNDAELKKELGLNAKNICEKYSFPEYVRILASYCIDGEKNSYSQKVYNLVNSVDRLEQGLVNKNNQIDSLKSEFLSLENEKNTEIAKLKKKNNQLTKQNDEILSSSSWKITSPIRKFRHLFKRDASQKNPSKTSPAKTKSKSKSKSKKSKSKITGRDKIDVLSMNKAYLDILNIPQYYKVHNSIEDVDRVNIFFEDIDCSINELSYLFSYVISYCNKYEYSLRIIYTNADFQVFDNFLKNNNLVLPDDTSFLNLKPENYLDIGFSEKIISASWKTAKRLLNTYNINSIIYFYLDDLNKYSRKEYFYVSNICYHENVVILNDDITKLDDLKKFNYEYALNMNNDLNNERKILCCDFGDMLIEGLDMLNYMIFNGIIDLKNWDVHIVSNSKYLKKHYKKHVKIIPERLKKYDLLMELNSKQEHARNWDNHVRLYVSEKEDKTYKVINIQNINETDRFNEQFSLSNVKRSKPHWPVEEIFKEIGVN